MHIKIREGLDIPMKGGVSASSDFSELETILPKNIALNLEGLSGKKGFHLLVKEGDLVKLGAPIAEDKEFPQSKLVATAAGRIKAIVRGAKRALESIVIETQSGNVEAYPPLMPSNLSRESLLLEMQRRGLFNHLRERPFNTVANPTHTPRSIFVKALESAPFVPQPDLQIQAYPEAFQAGLDFLKILTDGPIHLIHRKESCEAISKAKHVQHTTIEGPHPSSNPSVHIHHLDPIEDLQSCLWTLTAWDVLVIGKTLTSGHYFSEKIIAIAGEGIYESKRQLLRTVAGANIQELLQGRVEDSSARIILGDPLMGRAQASCEAPVQEAHQPEGYLHRSDSCLCAIASSNARQFLHFFRIGLDKYTASGAYLHANKPFSFTTHRHGEERAFIDAEPYQRVMPMQVPVMHLVKAVMAEDFDKSQALGLLEVDAEDFALPCFVCPSKIEMVDIMKHALHRWANEMR